jgi:hypothetical protein
VFVGILVRRPEDARASDLGFVQRRLDIESFARRTIFPQSPVEFPSMLGVDGRCVFGAGVVAKDFWIEVKESRHPVEDGPADRANKHPAVHTRWNVS